LPAGGSRARWRSGRGVLATARLARPGCGTGSAGRGAGFGKAATGERAVSEIALTADGERALKEAENFCWRTNVAIVAPEHLLAGALLVLGIAGHPGAPSAEQLEAAVLASQGHGSEELSNSVMFGSGARMA